MLLFVFATSMPFSDVRVLPRENAFLQQFCRAHAFLQGHGEMLLDIPLIGFTEGSRFVRHALPPENLQLLKLIGKA